MTAFEHIIVESKGAVGIVQINRPKMLNALSFDVFSEIATAIDDLEEEDDDDIVECESFEPIKEGSAIVRGRGRRCGQGKGLLRAHRGNAA